MEECNGNLPFIAIAGALHCVNHLQSFVKDSMQGMGCIAIYIALGKYFNNFTEISISQCKVELLMIGKF